MSQPTAQRPPQVTLASGIVMVSSFVVLLSAWERVSTLRSLETQDAIREFLAEAPFSSMGLDVAATTELLRIASLVAAAAACGTAILGWYVRKPDRGARLGLTLFAVPVFVGGLVAGGLAGSFVAAGAAMLWVMPAREWFATGRWTPPAPPAEKVRQKDRDKVATTRSAPTSPPVAGAMPPPAERPFGEHRPMAHGSAHGAARGTVAVGSREHHQLLQARPGAMIAAFVITVVTAGGLLTMSLLWLAIAGLSPEFLRSVIEQQQPDLFDDQMTFGQVRSTVVAFAAGFVVWCAVALALAGFAMARRDWARRGLIAMAAFSAAGCLVFAVAAPLVALPAAAAVATVVCLRRIEVRQWFLPPSH